MSFAKKLDLLLYKLNKKPDAASEPMYRFRAEIEFARQFAEITPDKQEEWQDLIAKALEQATNAIESGDCNLEKVVKEAEAVLAPIGEAAKKITVHCAGHAHIDMNWMWPWQETVNVCHDTFATIDVLMDEFPDFKFSQSQASTYFAMQQYHPEIFEMIKKRVKEGRWDVTASMWVEGDKNIVSGESLCRHMLYTRKYMKENLGLEPDDAKVDWSPDTFGHAHTLPSILNRGGVSRYFHMRTEPGPWVYKWRSPDGSEILVYNLRGSYNGNFDPQTLTNMVCDYIKKTGLNDFLHSYGVGDHGGGPTRMDLRAAKLMMDWPVYPQLKFSTTDEFYTAVENSDVELPVIDRDLNFIFEGCYTAQSRIKRANRVSELILPEAETMAVIAGKEAGMEYPYDLFFTGWRHTLFNHFHDILPGSGIHATYDYSEGLFQEVLAMVGSIKTRSLRKLATMVDTMTAAKCGESTMGSGFGDGLGAGAGDPGVPGGITALNVGALCAEPVLLYNTKPWERSETVYAKVWNKNVIDDRVIARDSDDNEVKGQVVARGNYWGHNFATVAFKAEVPAQGYKVYAIDNAPAPVPASGEPVVLKRAEGTWERSTTPFIVEPNVLENEFIRVEVDPASGAIASLIDKENNFEYVPPCDLIGMIEIHQEVPHGMSSWVIGQSKTITPLVEGGKMDPGLRGPNRASIITHHKYNESRISVEIGLNAGSRMVDFTLRTRWVEIGTPETGIPMIKAAFPINADNCVPTYEIPFGSQKREQMQQEVPALKWADISGETEQGAMGFTLVNNNKYGHSCVDDTMYLTCLRSSYEPDPLPEVADHEIKYALVLHKGAVDVVDAIKAGEEFNSPIAVVSAPVQKGTLPAEKSYVKVETPNVFVAAVKQAEASDAVVIRLFEVEGKETKAKIRVNDLVKADASAVEVDVLERPLDKNTAKLDGDTLTVSVPAYGQATVKIG